MVAENSTISFLYPLASFVIVFIFSYAIFSKTEVVGDNQPINLLISFIIASLFLTVSPSINFITTIIPIFAILLVGLFLILAFAKFTESPESLYKGIGITFIVLIGIAFVFSAFGVFANLIENTSSIALSYPPQITGTLIFILVSGGVGWILLR